MKKTLFLPILFLLFLRCNLIAQILDTFSSEPIYKEQCISKFQIVDYSEEFGYKYQFVESKYDHAPIYLEKDDFTQYFYHQIITTQRSTSTEGQKRNIKLSIRSIKNPSIEIFKMDKDCDEIILEATTCITAKYGCCGAFDYFEVYDYNNNLIVQGEGEVIKANIPNSRLKFYVGFVSDTSHSNVFGTLYYATTNNTKYAIKIKAKENIVKECFPYGNVFLKLKDKKDKINVEDKQYELWSLDGIENENLINNISINLTLEPTEYNPDTQMPCLDKKFSKLITIPIIQGKPFGKDLKNQEIILE